MTIENSPDDGTRGDIPVEDYFDDIKHSSAKRGRKMGLNKDGLFDQAKLPFIAGGSVLVLIIIMVFVFSGNKDAPETDQIQALESRITALETHIQNMDRDVENILQLEKQNKRIDMFMSRYAKLEADLSLKVDLLAKKMDKMQPADKGQDGAKSSVKSKTSATSIKKKAIAKATPAKQVQKRFHHVRKGDTLFSISRQYGIAVDKLRAMNSAIEGNNIYPGQKLRVAQ